MWPRMSVDAGVEAEGLGDVDAAFSSRQKRDRVGQQRLGGEQLDLKPLGQLDAAHGLERLGRGGLDLGVVLSRFAMLGRRAKSKARMRKERREEAEMATCMQSLIEGGQT